MADFSIVVDSGSDFSEEMIKEMGVKMAYLTFRFEGSEEQYDNRTMTTKEFYDRMRAGGVARSAAVNIDGFKEIFKEELEAGKDVLYIGFSSGISNTSNAGQLAARELAPKYPDRKIYAIDTLSAVSGSTLIAQHAADMRDKGCSIDEVAAFVTEYSKNMAIWFTVDDLVYLMRGGRLKPIAAFAGNLLKLKPVLHVTDEGTLANVLKAHGRKQSVKALADRFLQTSVDPVNGEYMISHTEAYEEALKIEETIVKAGGPKAKAILDLSTVIGSHTGPGALVISFPAKER